MLNRVLDLAKVTSGKLLPEQVEFELRAWLDETVGVHQALAVDKELTRECVRTYA